MIDIENLTLKQIKNIINMNSETINEIPENIKTLNNLFIGKVVIVRTYSAGVHFGTLEFLKGTEAILKNSRRIFSWEGAFTLSEISQKGIKESSKLSCTVPNIILTEAIEVIPCSSKSIEILNSIRDYQI